VLVLAAAVVLAVVFGSRLGRPPVSKPVTARGGGQEVQLARAIAAIKAEEIVSVLPADAIPALTNPTLVPADSAALDDDDPVIGVELEGEARAYSVPLLSRHEIVNDAIRGRPIAVSW